MDDTEIDRAVLRSMAYTLNVDPDGRLCPDIDHIANGDGRLPDKARVFTSRLQTNFKQARIGG